MYALTDAGRAALTDWVRHGPVEPPILKHGVALRVWLGHLAEPAELRSIVERHRDDATGFWPRPGDPGPAPHETRRGHIRRW